MRKLTEQTKLLQLEANISVETFRKDVVDTQLLVTVKLPRKLATPLLVVQQLVVEPPCPDV